MAVKYRKDLQNEQDLQNLVIGVINRMPLIMETFREEDVIGLVKRYSRGARFPISNELIRNIVNDYLDYFYIRNILVCRNGVYRYIPLNWRHNIPKYLAEHPL